MVSGLQDLIHATAQTGRVEWIGLRVARREPMQILDGADIREDGLIGDHGRPGKRAVTLIQHEHLAVIGAFLGQSPVDPGLLRRNIAVSGINLLALKGRAILIGTATLEITGPCAPCSRMEEALGHGGYSAVRGHGGVTARVVAPGHVTLNSSIKPVD